MLTQALRFILLRFLPRRVLPILTAIEVFRLIQRLRRRILRPAAMAVACFWASLTPRRGIPGA